MIHRRFGLAFASALTILVAFGGSAAAQGPDASSPNPSGSTDVVQQPVLGDCKRNVLPLDEYGPLAQPWIDALWSFYATGDADELARLTTPRGLASLAASDWRYVAVEQQALRFAEVPRISGVSTSNELCAAGGERLGIYLEPIIDIDGGASIADADLDRIIERVEGEQRRAFALTFVRSSKDAELLLDDIGPLIDDTIPPFVKPTPARACPGHKSPGQAADPFLQVPWCTAGGDGRLVRTNNPGRELGVGRPFCWAGSHQIVIGLPPGTARGYDNTRVYVRDPRGTVTGAKGFRRDIRPPKDAISTGITNGHVTIWTSDRLGDEWLLMQVGDRFERWPRFERPCPAN